MDPNVAVYLDVLSRNAGGMQQAGQNIVRGMERRTEMDFTRERDQAARQFSA